MSVKEVLKITKQGVTKMVMVRLKSRPDPDEAFVYVNPLLVRFIESEAREKTILHFDLHQRIEIYEPLQRVSNLLSEGSRQK
jgi:hypothetical protein